MEWAIKSISNLIAFINVMPEFLAKSQIHKILTGDIISAKGYFKRTHTIARLLKIQIRKRRFEK